MKKRSYQGGASQDLAETKHGDEGEQSTRRVSWVLDPISKSETNVNVPHVASSALINKGSGKWELVA